jgi:hypothetical protein
MPRSGTWSVLLARAEAGGSTDDDALHIEMNENDEIAGFSLCWIQTPKNPDVAAHVLNPVTARGPFWAPVTGSYWRYSGPAWGIRAATSTASS